MPQNTLCYFDQYDEIAEVYDTLFVDKGSLKENDEISKMLSNYKGSFYDIGCGTGLLIEIASWITPKNYHGVDPSEGMLKRFKEKFPSYKDCLSCHLFEGDPVDFRDFDNVVSTFGSISYVMREELVFLADSKVNLFLMFYKPDYHPATYEKTGKEFSHYVYSEEELSKIFKGCLITTFNNYLIVTRK